MYTIIKRATVIVLLTLAMMLTACSQKAQTIASKSTATLEDLFIATMSAAGQAYKKGLMTEEQKTEVVQIGKVVKNSISLAWTAIDTFEKANTPENESKVWAAVAAIKENLSELIDRVVEFGVSVKNIINVTGEGNGTVD